MSGHYWPVRCQVLWYFVHFDASKAMLVITSAIPPSPMMAKDSLTLYGASLHSLHTGSSIYSRSQPKLAGFQFPLALAQAVPLKYFALPRKSCPAGHHGSAHVKHVPGFLFNFICHDWQWVHRRAEDLEMD